MVFLALGNYTEAQQAVQAALEANPDHVPALFAAAQLLLASAKYRIVQGTPGHSIFPSFFISLAHLLLVCIPAVVACLLCRCLLIWGSPQRPLSLFGMSTVSECARWADVCTHPTAEGFASNVAFPVLRQPALKQAWTCGECSVLGITPAYDLSNANCHIRTLPRELLWTVCTCI